MPKSLPVGPYKSLTIDGATVPWYIIPFDRDGACTQPKTRDELVTAAEHGDFTDVFLFSHGWNNDWKTASGRYDDFISGYTKLRTDRALKYPAPHKPLLVGVFWPSTALVAPWEKGPNIAAADPALFDAGVESLQDDVAELASAIAVDQRSRFYKLMQSDEALSGDERTELAGILAPVWNDFQGNNAGDLRRPAVAITADQLVALWGGTNEAKSAGDAWGFAPDTPALGAMPIGDATAAVAPAPVATPTLTPATPQAAFGIGDVVNAPRDFARLFTVLQMKDRAATVGARGVAPLLVDLLAKTNARIHVVGHSYGAVVLLSALCFRPTEEMKRPVASVLLLQPAVSRYCFAERVPKHDYAGGYRRAFTRCEQPILTTFSSYDVPLTKFFHLAVRRDRDLGQPFIAAEIPVAPSDYAALGGYGPAGCSETECQYDTIHDVGVSYKLVDTTARVIGLRSDDAIGGHGDISVEATWWALYNQVVPTN